MWVLTLVPVALRLQGWRTYPYHRAGSPEPVVGVPWWLNVSPYRRDLLAVSWHRAVHVRSALVAPWDLRCGSLLLYPWLSGCRAGVHTHTTEPEALSQLWSPSGLMAFGIASEVPSLAHVSHVARVHLAPVAMVTDDSGLGHYSDTCGSAVTGLVWK